MDRDDRLYKTIYTDHLIELDRLRGSVSPRENGKLKLRANGLEKVKFVQNVNYVKDVSQGLGDMVIGWYGPGYPEWPAAYNTAYAKFRGVLYYGSASLGVTLASTRQSIDMIKGRYKTLNLKAAAAEAFIATFGNMSRKKKLKAASSLHLEIIFGWTPLITDIHATTQSLCQHAIPPIDVNTSHTARIKRVTSVTDSGGWLSYTMLDEGVLKVKIGSEVLIENPNLWLAERAGLLNTATVAWDLVPWSFLVNIFVNVGQLVQSLTDFSGLKLDNTYVSTTLKATRTIGATYRPPPDWRGPHVKGGYSNQVVNSCYRSLGLQTPSIEFKLPPLELGSLAMAASLFAQKLGRISSVLAPLIRK